MTGAHRSTYLVSVAGPLGPVLRHAFGDLEAWRTPPSTVFRLRLPAGTQPADLAALLQARGLELLSARPVPDGRPQRAPA